MERKIRPLPIIIIISALLVCGALVLNILPHRYKVVGNRVFDTFKGMYVDPGKIDYMPRESTKTSTQIPETVKEAPAGDISKVIIAGSSFEVNSVAYTITCTIQNNDNVEHIINVKIIYYDKDKSPISTQSDKYVTIGPGDIQGVTISQRDNIEKIDSYEIKVSDSFDW